MFNYSTDFVDAAAAMGYDCHDRELPPEVEIAVKNQMKKDAKFFSHPGKLGDVWNAINENEETYGEDFKDIADKPDPLLIPYEAIVAYSKVSDHGLKVHGSRNTWMNNTPEEGVAKYTAACGRHLHQSRTEAIDTESGLPHIYAVLWNAASAIWHYDRMK